MQTRYEVIEFSEWRNETQSPRYFDTWDEAARYCAFLNATKRPRRFWVRERQVVRLTKGAA